LNIYKLKQNEETLKNFSYLEEALDYMHIKFAENKSADVHFRLIHETDNHAEVLLELPQIRNNQLKDFHPLIQNLYNILYEHQDELLLELDKRLKILDKLEISAYTEDIANNNYLDLIKLADLTEFSVMYCPECKELQQTRAEGCYGVILLICNECDNIITELHRKD
jgi:hypothetical protein